MPKVNNHPLGKLGKNLPNLVTLLRSNLELRDLDFLRTGPCFQLSKISDLNKGNSEGKTLQFSTEFIRIKSYVNDESTGGMPLRSMLCEDK
jgi:hypothetical protein